jgi:hypothetical protein
MFDDDVAGHVNERRELCRLEAEPQGAAKQLFASFKRKFAAVKPMLNGVEEAAERIEMRTSG